MRYFSVIILIYFCFFSCKNEEKSIEYLIEDLIHCNFKLMEDVRIKARTEREGKYIAYKFSKKLEGKYYTLPDFNFHQEKQSQNKSIFDELVYAKAKGITMDSLKKYSKEVIQTFECSKMVEIISDSKIGDCIIFHPNNDSYIIHVLNPEKIYNEFWKEQILKAKEVQKGWYVGFLDK